MISPVPGGIFDSPGIEVIPIHIGYKIDDGAAGIGPSIPRQKNFFSSTSRPMLIN